MGKCKHGLGVGPLLFLLLMVVGGSLLSQAEAEHEHEHEVGQVMEVMDSRLDSAIASFDHILVLFYGPSCARCNIISHELDAAAPMLAENTPPILLAKMDAHKYKNTALKYNISAYPTLKFFIKGVPIAYNGPCKADFLISHLIKAVSPDVITLESDSDLNRFMKTTGSAFPYFIGFDIQESVVRKVAEQHKSRAWFAVVEKFTENAMVEYDFDKMPALVALRPKYQEQEVFYGIFDGSDLTEFVQQNLLPLVNELNYFTLKELKEDGRPIVLALSNDLSDDHSRILTKNMKAAAPANRAFLFAYIDASKWPELSEAFHIREKSPLPTLLIWDGYLNYYSSSRFQGLKGHDSASLISLLLDEYDEGNLTLYKVRDLSFTDYVTSYLNWKIVYTLIFLVVLAVFFRNSGGRLTIADKTIRKQKDSIVYKGEQLKDSSSSKPETGCLDSN